MFRASQVSESMQVKPKVIGIGIWKDCTRPINGFTLFDLLLFVLEFVWILDFKTCVLKI
jgi:hypothetical protein